MRIGSVAGIGCVLVGMASMIPCAAQDKTPAVVPASQPWMNAALDPDARADMMIKEMTLDESTNQVQKVAKVRVYPGADGSFELYRDDGTYAYEKGQYEVSHLRWDDAAQKLTHTGAEVRFASGEAVEVVGRR